MERCWRQTVGKERLNFWHVHTFLGLLLDDRFLNARPQSGAVPAEFEGGQKTGGKRGETLRRRLRLASSLFKDMVMQKIARERKAGGSPLEGGALNAAGATVSSDPDPTPQHWQRVYNLMLRACANIADGVCALEVWDHMQETGFSAGEETMSFVVMALAKARMRLEAQARFEEAVEKGLVLSPAAKSCLISCHARALDGEAAARVLEVTVEDGRSPENPGVVSGNMVTKVLEVGIETGNVKVLRQGLNALTMPVDRGMGLQILNMAAKRGDGQLAMDVFYALEGWGFSPTASVFNAVIQALGISKNDVAMLKALNEMCALGFTPSEGTLHLVARQLSKSVARLDEAYNNLVALQKAYQDHVRQEAEGRQEQQAVDGKDGEGADPAFVPNAPLPVSGSAVYLIVLGCAYANQLDRAFATFEDYQPVFGLAYDTNASNALLLACLRSRSLQVGAAISVMNEMDRLGIAPNDETCHLMVRILAQAKEADVKRMESVLSHMDEKGVVLRPATQRLLILWYALLGEHDRAQELLSGMHAQGCYVPSYFEERLKQIRLNGDRL